MKGRKKKRPVTLIEMMIVIMLIGLIGGALAVNMRGSMNKGRIFKTEQNISRVYDALMMEYAKGEIKTLQEIIDKRETILEKCPFVKDGNLLLKDAWGEELTFEIDSLQDDLIVTSSRITQRDAHG